MFNNAVLDVVIGLIFIFLLYSLLATIVQEIIATQLAFRAKILEKAILRMLEDGKTTSRYQVLDRIIGFLQMIFRVNRLKNKKFAAAFYAHPLIKYLAEDNYHSKPAYLHACNFSKIMIDLLHGMDQDMYASGALKVRESLLKAEIVVPRHGHDKAHPANKALDQQEAKDKKINKEQVEPTINPETQQFLLSLLNDAQGDLHKFRAALERWYDDTMERATGWYKRYTQVVLFGIGITIAMIFNVDAISIAKKLSRDPKLRQQVVENANTLLEKEQQLGGRLQTMQANKQDTGKLYGDAQTSYDSLKTRLATLSATAQTLVNEDVANANKTMGLGWKDLPKHSKFLGMELEGFGCFKCNNIRTVNIVGWILTALAISLGSPFWFDLLTRMMNLRGTGNKVKAPDPNSSQSPVVVNVKTKTSDKAPAQLAIGNKQ